jgi:hypothetical protein
MAKNLFLREQTLCHHDGSNARSAGLRNGKLASVQIALPGATRPERQACRSRASGYCFVPFFVLCGGFLSDGLLSVLGIGFSE